MGRNSTKELITGIGNALSTEPKSIQDITNEINADRKAVSRYLEALKDADLIKHTKQGRKQLYWKPTLSDRQTGLELRGTAYNLTQMKEELEQAQEQVENLIEKTADPVQVKEE